MFSNKRVVFGGLAVIGVVVIAFAWWLLSPLFLDKTVDEEFPFAASAIIPTGMTMQEVDQIMATMAKVNVDSNEGIPDIMSDSSSPDKMAASVVSIKSGEFQGADSLHKGSGTATIYQNEDGSNILRLENFSVTNGPDLRVILSPHPNPEGRDDVTASGYVDLGKLKGNRGNQNYVIPDDVDVSGQMSVVIYCQPFRVVFSVAELQDSA